MTWETGSVPVRMACCNGTGLGFACFRLAWGGQDSERRTLESDIEWATMHMFFPLSVYEILTSRTSRLKTHANASIRRRLGQWRASGSCTKERYNGIVAIQP